MTAYDDWLEKPYLDEDEKQDAIDDEIDHLLQTEFNPTDVEVFLNAIDNGCLNADKDQLIQTIKDNAPWEELGRYVFKAVQTYCIDHAIKQATKTVNENHSFE